jgi:aminoglycoside phosphotransferase (APT) family kinase protein
MIMKHIEGLPLDFLWDNMTVAQQANIIRQLRDIIVQLRSIPPPDQRVISGINGRRCIDARVATQVLFGPFRNEAGFNDFLAKNAEGHFSPDPFIDKTPTMMRNDHRIVFTHGDFAPRNIMVQWHVVVGLIDWEHSGAYNA